MQEQDQSKRRNRQTEQVEGDGLGAFKDYICHKYEIENINDLVASIERITEEKTILKYITKDKIPECGYVFKVIHKNPVSGKAGEVDIYDDLFCKINIPLPKQNTVPPENNHQF